MYAYERNKKGVEASLIRAEEGSSISQSREVSSVVRET